jgi:hypothetical protein
LSKKAKLTDTVYLQALNNEIENRLMDKIIKCINEEKDLMCIRKQGKQVETFTTQTVE